MRGERMGSRSGCDFMNSDPVDPYLTAFRSGPDLMTISRLRDGIFVDANDNILRMIGYSREEIIGRSALDLSLWSNPRDREELVEELLREGTVDNRECTFRTRDGRMRTERV